MRDATFSDEESKFCRLHSVERERLRMASCTGKFKLTQSENFEEFMKVLGVGLVTRKLGNKSSPTVTITEDAGEFTFKQESLVKTSEIKFKIGQEFDELTADGRQGRIKGPLAGTIFDIF